jgi:hypothetical protein
MKFNLPQPLPDAEDGLRTGNVYRCQGGGKTRYWIVVGMDERTVNLLGINGEGEVSSTANYGRHVFESAMFKVRPVIGFCAGVTALNLDVAWSDFS